MKIGEKKPKIGVLLYTYDRVDDARINLEIMRRTWQKSELLRDVVIVHAFNGERAWWPEKYLEDDLLHLENPGHFGGAELLMNEGMKTFAARHPDVDYVIILAADTWCAMPEYLERVIMDMRREGKYLEACSWGSRRDPDMFKAGMSIDLAIVDLSWAIKYALFPLRYQQFVDAYGDIFAYDDRLIVLELVFAVRFRQAIMKSETIRSENSIKKLARERVRQMAEREPVLFAWRGIAALLGKPRGDRKMYWPNIGLITHHDPVPKQKAAKSWHLDLGEYGKNFLAAKDLSYFNNNH